MITLENYPFSTNISDIYNTIKATINTLALTYGLIHQNNLLSLRSELPPTLFLLLPSLLLPFCQSSCERCHLVQSISTDSPPTEY